MSDFLRLHGLQDAGFSVLHYLQSLLKFMSTESVMLFNHHILCCPLLLLPSIFPSIRVFSNVLAFRIRWPKYWSFGFSISLLTWNIFEFSWIIQDFEFATGKLRSSFFLKIIFSILNILKAKHCMPFKERSIFYCKVGIVLSIPLLILSISSRYYTKIVDSYYSSISYSQIYCKLKFIYDSPVNTGSASVVIPWTSQSSENESLSAHLPSSGWKRWCTAFLFQC